MVTETKQVITLEELKRHLPYSIRRVGREYRTYLEPDSRSRTDISINIEKQKYYDFRCGQGGSLMSLVRQVGVPTPYDRAKSNPQLTYIKQLAIIARFKTEGRYYGCGKATAEKTNLRTGHIVRDVRVMCLRWSCPRCAPFLKELEEDHFAPYHCGGIWLVPKNYQVSKALDRLRLRAKRAGGEFIWWLLQSNDYQILFVNSGSYPEVKDWLDKEPYFERATLNPSIKERDYWMDKGLEKMNEPMHLNHKVRHSRAIPSLKANVANVINTGENITLPTSPTPEPLPAEVEQMVKGLDIYQVEYDGKVYISDKVVMPCFFGYQWNIIGKTLEERLTELESQGYKADWLSGDIVDLIPPTGESP